MENIRLSILRNEMKRLNLTAMIVSGKENIIYLTNLDFPGFLIITNEDSMFFTYSRYFKKALESINIYSETVVKDIEKEEKYLSTIFSEDDLVAVESEYITLKEFDNIKKIFKTNFIETEKMIEKIREVKDEDEIKKIEEIGKEISNSLENAERLIRPHKSEIDLRLEIKKELEKRNIEAVLVRVSSGENTSDPYYNYGFRRFHKDDIICVDIVGKKDGYYCTLARTFFLGDIDKDIKDIYLKIYKVHDKMLKNLKKYNKVSDIYKEIKKELEDINWNIKYFVANGTGLSEYEEPIFELGNYTNIRKNMVISICPQIYFLEKFGIILKDTIYITDANFIFCTKYDKRNLEDICF